MKKIVPALAFLALAAGPAMASQISDYLTVANTSASVPSNWIACLETTGECRFNKEATAQVFSTLPVISPSAGGTTNLGVGTHDATQLIVTSDTGTDATLPLATAAAGTNKAGLMSPAQKDKLDGIAAGATAAGATGDAYATSHEADTTAHPAANIVNTPAGTIAATTVQAALNELDSEKAPVSTTVATTGNQTIGGVKTFSSDPLIPTEVYGVGWNGVFEPPTKDAVYDVIEGLSLGTGFYATDGDVGLTVDAAASAVTTTWAPPVNDGAIVKATGTSCALDVLDPTGTVGTGEVYKRLEITNNCGSDMVVTFSGLTPPGNRLTAARISNGSSQAFNITTRDGTTWRFEDGVLDMASLPAGTVASADLLTCQDVSTTPDAWFKCTAQAIADLKVEANNLGTAVVWANIPDANVSASAVTQHEAALEGVLDLPDMQGTLGVTKGGTGRTTSTTAYGLIAAGTTATGAHQTLAAGATTEVLVGGGASALPVWTTATGSGAPVRAISPALTTPNIGTPSAAVLTNATGLPSTAIVYTPNNQTDNYNVVSGDKGKIVTCNKGTAMTITVPTAAITWADGDLVYFANKGAGACTISGSGVTINVAADQTAALAQYKAATLMFTSDTTAILFGGMSAP